MPYTGYSVLVIGVGAHIFQTFDGEWVARGVKLLARQVLYFGVRLAALFPNLGEGSGKARAAVHHHTHDVS